MYNKKQIINNLLFLLIGMIVSFFILFVIWKIQQIDKYQKNYTPFVYESGEYGSLVATGPDKITKIEVDIKGQYYSLYDYEIILDSILISNEDKNEISRKGIDKKEKFSFAFFIKDGKDMILLCNETKRIDNEENYLYYFESNLPYKFTEILGEFDKSIQNIDTNKIIINVDFIYLSKEKKYIPYYTIMYDNKIYVLNKD